jgi:hypothetical protein
MIYDTFAITTAATDQVITFFNGVSSRTYPATNLSSNRFEVGESLAIQGFTWAFFTTATTNLSNTLSPRYNVRGGILNFYIGNQRVIKDLEICTYSRFGIGEAISSASEACVFRLETPIVVPPQIEYYATLRLSTDISLNGNTMLLSAFGTGTLLNTKSNF